MKRDIHINTIIDRETHKYFVKMHASLTYGPLNRYFGASVGPFMFS